MSPAPEPAQALREHGLRVTRPRVAVLEALHAEPHLRAEQVITAVRADGEVSGQAVYDVLNVLSAHGLVRRIQPRGSVARYELETGDNHHHVVCRGCGRVSDVECATGEAPCLDLPETTSLHGFSVDEAEVTWWGHCPACSRTTPTTD
ncbi:Fur family transcriptional regulator [Nocardioides cynanchi]|uniref:Fur family transcriptional regulator n=1 Tax=Nocardioides cynanchi TaxID=2558918 RepID=UPI001243D086|nr:Fur family transcriptional regulator [Nocardioides cynanchi]